MKQKKINLNELEALMTGFWLTDLSNFAAFFFDEFENINWIGFYLSDDKKLRLGPFQGKPACTEIEFTRGVCGAAYSANSVKLVDDVHAFDGHISCDPRSRSELVIPLALDGEPIGVLDIDSPIVGRFTIEDSKFFSSAVDILLRENASMFVRRNFFN